MGLTRMLTDDERAELAGLTEAVKTAIFRRRIWLDRKMQELSDIQVGDVIEDQNGHRLGIVSRLYRFWRDREEGIHDTQIAIEYEYLTGNYKTADNTSRQPLLQVRKSK